MKAEVAAGAHPWIDSYKILAANPHISLNWTPRPVSIVYRGFDGTHHENYGLLYNDIAAVYQDTLMWKITGNTAYADKAVQICDAWSSTLTAIEGTSDKFLAAGIYGYEFANAAENLYGYPGWTSADLAKFQKMMLDVFYPMNHSFLVNHNGTCIDHYYANWDECNYASMLATGVLCDDRAKYNEAVTYFKTGGGAGGIETAVYHIHPGLLGQLQESGRDQGHSGLNIALLGATCQMAWNQGDDLFGYDNNRFLSAAEYFAKYNLGNPVPFVNYENCSGFIQTVVSAGSRGDVRPIWALVYNHYANLLGIACPYTKQYVAHVGAEGGGGNFGPNSGGYDQLGFTTLTCTLPPTTANRAPSGITASVNGTSVTLSWWGSATATSYYVARSTVSGGPYTQIASNVTTNSYTDPMAVPGVTYYYVVSSVSPTGVSGYSMQIAATPNRQLTGTIIGTPGSYYRWPTGSGQTIANAFDGCLQPGNFVDGPDASGDWLGLDFGSDYAYVVDEVRVCPRAGLASRMVGGQIQGSNTADFSSGVTTLYTITTAPTDSRQFTDLTFGNSTPFRYVRYLSPNKGYCNISEIQFYGNTLPNGTYKIVNRNSGLDLTVAGGKMAEGSPIYQAGDQSRKNQLWTLTSLGNGQYKLVGIQSGRSLDIRHGSTADGALADIRTYLGKPSQHFAMMPTDSGYFRITPAHSDKALAVSDKGSSEHAKVDQWIWTGADDQQWKLVAP
jgi:hypothetical protein